MFHHVVSKAIPVIQLTISAGITLPYPPYFDAGKRYPHLNF